MSLALEVAIAAVLAVNVPSKTSVLSAWPTSSKACSMRPIS